MNTDTLKIEGTDYLLTLDELDPELAEALMDCGAAGDASDAVEYVRANWEVIADETEAAAYLKGYGAWDEEELANHQKNLDRLVWLIGCDLKESGEAYLCTY